MKTEYLRNINKDDKIFNEIEKSYFDFWFGLNRSIGSTAMIEYTKQGNLEYFVSKELRVDKIELRNQILPLLPRIKITNLLISDNVNDEDKSKIIDSILEYARNLKVKEIYIIIFRKHFPIVDLLKKHNFELVGEKDTGEEVYIRKDIV